MFFNKMHHVGIVLPTEEDMFAFMKQYGLETDRIADTPYQSKAYFTKAGPGECPIEFLIAEGGPLAAFNNGKGGIHHICYEVDNIEKTTAMLQEMGCEMLESQPQNSCPGKSSGFGNIKINFVRPRSSYGVLVELWEEK